MNSSIRMLMAVVGIVALAIIGVAIFMDRGPDKVAAVSTPGGEVTDVRYGVSYAVGHTFLCNEKGVGVARDWHFTDRWVKNQLSYDRYEVDGRSYEAFQIVTDDSTLPAQHVRFRKEIVTIAGPRLEGHDYMRTLIDGREATIQKELLLVDFNGRLEPQARPFPVCGKPRR